jgi:hypothetical protein
MGGNPEVKQMTVCGWCRLPRGRFERGTVRHRIRSKLLMSGEDLAGNSRTAT